MSDHVTCVWKIYEEKFGSSMWSFSWFGQKGNKIESKAIGVTKLL